VAAVLRLSTLVALPFLDRLEAEPWPLLLFAVASVPVFFGPVTARSLGFIHRFF